MLETSQLQTLVAVAKYSSFSKAGEELGVTQSAISQSIKNLEKKVEAPLFKRSGKQVMLTQEGEKLYRLARSYLSKVEDLLDEISDGRQKMKGRLRVGTLYGVGKSWLGHELVEFTRENNDLSVEIVFGSPSELVESYEKLSLDAIIVPEYAVPHSGIKTLLGVEKSTLVFPKSGEFEVHPNMGLEELSELPTILFERDDDLYTKWCRHNFKTAPRKIHRRLIINSHGNILRAVSLGLGVAVVPTHVLARSGYLEGVSTLGADFEVENSKMYFVCHKEAEQTMRIQSLKHKLQTAQNPLSATIN